MTKHLKTAKLSYKDILDFFNKMNKENEQEEIKDGYLVHVPSQVYRFKKAELTISSLL